MGLTMDDGGGLDPFAGLTNFTRIEHGALPGEFSPGAFRVHGSFDNLPGTGYLDDFYLFTDRGCAVRTKAMTFAGGEFKNAKLEDFRYAGSATETKAYSIDIGRTHSNFMLVNLGSEDARIDDLSAFAAKTFEEIVISGQGDPTFDTLEKLEQKCQEMGIEYRTR